MSNPNTDLLSAAKLLQERLSGLEKLADVGVFADVVKDLRTQKEIDKHKNAGAVVVIEPVSGDKTDPAGKALQFDVSYVISLWTHPGQVKDQAHTAGERLIDIMEATNLWKPFGDKFPTHRFEIQGWDLVEDKNFHVLAITAQLTEIYRPA